MKLTKRQINYLIKDLRLSRLLTNNFFRKYPESRKTNPVLVKHHKFLLDIIKTLQKLKKAEN
jgi:hypothetical protein